MQVTLRLLIFFAQNAVGRSELGHDQPAAVEVADEAAKDRVGDAGHGREDGGGGDGDSADGKACGDWARSGLQSSDCAMRALRSVPAFLHCSILRWRRANESPRRWARAGFERLR